MSLKDYYELLRLLVSHETFCSRTRGCPKLSYWLRKSSVTTNEPVGKLLLLPSLHTETQGIATMLLDLCSPYPENPVRTRSHIHLHQGCLNPEQHVRNEVPAQMT